ncbi:glycosyltransferase [Luminiphilus sp.]|nr:glycosyltransferase [Luminiphilus sp.]
MEGDFQLGSNIVIPSIIDVSDYRATPRSLDNKTIKLLYFGSPVGKEDVALMIQAFSEVADLSSGFELHFTGVEVSDFSQPEIQEYLMRHLNKSIYIHGWLDRGEMMKIAQEANFLFFIREEKYTNKYNFPTKLAESFAMGLPCMCNLYGPYSEYVNTGNSVVLRDVSVSGVVSEIRHLPDITPDEYSQLCSGALETAEKCFNIRAYERDLERFLNENL